MPNALALLDNIGAPIKALVERRVPYSLFSGGYSSYGGYSNSALADNYASHSPGASFDYMAEAGELMDNFVVASCVRVIADAMAAAPPFLEEKQGDKWVRVDDDEPTGLLSVPMEATTNGYGGVHLWGATAAWENTAGQAFWIVNYKGSKPVELRIENPCNIRFEATGEKFISKYQLLVDGRPMDLKDNQVIHLRAALHHFNPRIGWCPLLAGHRQVAGLNLAATYSSALMRNVTAIGYLMTLKYSPEQANAAQVDPDTFEMVSKRMQAKFTGEGAGGLAAVNFPVDLIKMGLSPDEMAIPDLMAMFKADICGLMGVDPDVAMVGRGEQPTYQNMKEKLRDFWERRIQPVHVRYRSELGAQYLPLFDLDPNKYRIAFDYSEIDALNENKDEVHARTREDYKAGAIDLHTFQAACGYAAEDWMKGVYTPAANPKPPEPSQGQSGVPGDGRLQAIRDATEGERLLTMVKSWNETLHPRDRDGKFSDGGASSGELSIGEVMSLNWAKDKTSREALAYAESKFNSGTLDIDRERILHHIIQVLREHVPGEKSPHARIGDNGAMRAGDPTPHPELPDGYTYRQALHPTQGHAGSWEVLDKSGYPVSRALTIQDAIDAVNGNAVGNVASARSQAEAFRMQHEAHYDHRRRARKSLEDGEFEAELDELELKAWEESQHPRDKDGKFGSGGTGEVRRVERAPFNFVLYRDGDGKEEIRISTGGKFIEEPSEKLMAEAKEALSIPDKPQSIPDKETPPLQDGSKWHNGQSVFISSKPPYEMSKEEFAERFFSKVPTKNRSFMANRNHKMFIKRALAEGRTVPPSVLSQYGADELK